MDRFAAGARDFFHLHNIQASSGAQPASYPMGIGVTRTSRK